MNRYSLANHILSIKPNDGGISTFGTIEVGGEGSYLDSVSISTPTNLWNTQGFATGGWIHDKNLSRIGTVDITLNQLSDQVKKFITMCENYYGGDYNGFTITLSKNDGSKIASCIDCYISKIPDQSYGQSSANQTWTFTCGQITYN